MLHKVHRIIPKNALLGSSRIAAKQFGSDSVTYEFKDLILDPNQKGKEIYELHRLEKSQMPNVATTNKAELMSYLDRMIRMRRTEVEADKLYKNHKIRGFCHLYDG